MPGQAGSVKKYAALESYLKAKSIDVKFVHFSDYNKAASMFAPATIKHILAALMAVGTAPDAASVCEGMKIQGFVMTTGNDFKHTLELLKHAGVTAKYEFK